MRKRVATLYSGETKNGDDNGASQEITPPEKQETRAKFDDTSAVVREVAKGMFMSMCKDFEEEIITEENMEEAVQNLADDSINPTYSLVQTHAYALSSEAIRSSIRKLLQDVEEQSSNGEVTCELFCEAAVGLAKGNISLFGMQIASAHDHKHKPQQANLEALLYHPRDALALIKREVLKMVEKRGSRWLWSFFSTKHFYWVLAVYFVPMMTVQVIVSSVNTALFNATMLFLLIVTIQIIINSEILQSRIEYLSLFQYFNKARGPIKMPVLTNSDVPYYVTFVGGVAMGVVFLGFSNHSFVYNELLAFISLIISALVLLQFDLYESPFLWSCVLAKSPSWLTLGVEKLCSLIGRSPPQLLSSMREPILTIPLIDELYFDVNTVTLLQVSLHLGVVLVFFAKLKDSFRSPGPHVLFLGWFVLSRNFFAMSSATHLAIVSTSVVLFPFYTLAFFLSPFYFLFYYGFSPPFYYSLESIGIMAVVSMLIWFSYKRKREWLMNLSIEYVLLLCLAACVCSVMFLSGWYASVFHLIKSPPSVSQVEYIDYCGPGNWVNGNSIQTQINCVHLQGRAMTGRADVDSVSISRIQNSMADSILFLPYFLERALTCYLGKSEPMCGDRVEMSTCIYTGCNFQHSLAYTFEIKLVIPISSSSSIKATMLVSHRYKDFVMKLESGSSLQFNATFVEGMGSGHLTLQARSLSASGLETRDLDKEKELEANESMWSVFLQSIKNSATMIFEIFFGYTT